MKLPENPILRIFAVIFAVVFGVVALGYVGVVGLLIAVSLPDPSRTELVLTPPAWTATTDIYLRNRMAVPLRVELTLARPATRPDTVWWPVAISPEAVGQALALRDSLVTQGLYYPLPAPLLLLGTVDTLIDKNFDDSLPRSLLHHKRYNSKYSASAHAGRRSISQPELGREVGLHNVPGAPDSLRLVLDLLPDSTLRVARRQVAYFDDAAGTGTSTALTAREGDNWPYLLDARQVDEGPAVPPAAWQHRPLAVRVRWRDAQGHPHQQRPPLAALLQLPAAAVSLPGAGHHQVRRYWDYR
jgi:hypothetical protein